MRAAVILTLSLLLAFPAHAGTPEEQIYAWSECLGAGTFYTKQAEEGSTNADIKAGAARYAANEKRFFDSVDPALLAVGEERASEISAKARSFHVDAIKADIRAGTSLDDAIIRQFGPVLDRCMAEYER